MLVTEMESQFQILRSFSEVESIRDIWTRLQWHPNSDIDFYRIVCESMATVIRPHVLVLWREGVPISILVGRLEDDRLTVRVGYSTIPGPRTRSLVFIYGGLLGSPSPEECTLMVGKILSALRRGEADRVFFNHLPTNGSLYAALMTIPRFYPRDWISSVQVHRRLTLSGTIQEFKGRLSPKMRKNLRWYANRLDKEHNGEVRIGCFSKPSEFEAMMNSIESVAARTYQRGLGSGIGSSWEDRSRLQLKADRGVLLSFLLYVKDKPCAFWVGTHYGNTFHSEYMGFDPEYKKFSPGMYLLIKVIERFYSLEGDRKITAIDFGLGDAEYKRVIADEEWNDASPCIFAPTLKGMALNAYRIPLTNLDRFGRLLLSDHLENRVKRIWRDRMARRATSVALRRVHDAGSRDEDRGSSL